MRGSVKTKVSLLFLVIFLVSSAILCTYAVFSVKRNTLQLAQSKLDSDLRFASSLVSEQYPGDWKVANGTLYKGNTKMNKNSQLVDQLQSITKDDVTLFMGATRVATTVKTSDGQRAIGTKASASVVAKTLQAGQVFKGEANVVGISEETVYQPLKDATGHIVGMLFVGEPRAPFDQVVTAFRDRISIAALLEAIIAGLISFFLLSRQLNPLKAMMQRARQIAVGDLSGDDIAVHSDDEVGTLTTELNQMTQRLKQLILNIRGAADTLSAASEQLAANTEETTHITENIVHNMQTVSDGVTQQANRVEMDTDTLTMVDSRIEKIRMASNQVNHTATKANELAHDGASEAHFVGSQMKVIQGAVRESAQIIAQLAGYADHIQSILGDVASISGQTKLLSLNASIEAARAGEHGRGFLVVAEEIKKLSDKSAQAVLQANEIIGQTLKLVNESNDAMHQVQQEVESGQKRVERAEVTFTAITDSVATVTTEIGSVATQADDISQAIAELSANFRETAQLANDMSLSVQQVAASSEQQLGAAKETKSASEELMHMAEELQQTVMYFQLS